MSGPRLGARYEMARVLCLDFRAAQINFQVAFRIPECAWGAKLVEERIYELATNAINNLNNSW